MARRLFQIGTIASFAYTAVLLVCAIRAPFLGFYYYLGTRIEAVDPGSPAEAAGLVPGDEITGLGGKAVSSALDLSLGTSALRAGEPVSIDVRSGRSIRSLQLTPVRRWRDGRWAAGLLCAFIFWAFAYWPYRRQPHLPAARALYAFSIVLFPVITFVPLLGRLYNQPIPLALWAIPASLSAALSLHIPLTFPRVHPWLKDRPERFAALYVPGLFFLFYLLIRMAMLWTSPSGEPALAAASLREIAGAAAAYLTYLFTCGILALLVVFQSYRRAGPGIERRQVKWLFWGGFITLLFGVAAVVRTIQNVRLVFSGALVPWELGPMFPIIGLSWALALNEFRLPDVDRWLARSLALGASVFLSAGYFVLLAWGLRDGLSVSPETAGIGAAILVALLFHPMEKQIQDFSERLLVRDAPDLLDARARFSEQLMRTGEVAPLVAQVTSDLKGLWGCASVRLFSRDAQGRFAVFPKEAGLAPPALEPGSPLVGHLLQHRKPLQVWKREAGGLPPEAASEIVAREAAVAVPLFETPKKLLGLFLLGPKSSGDIYGVQDIELLAALAPLWALALRNAMAYQEIAALTQRQEELLAERTSDLAQARQTIRTLRGLKHEPWRGLAVGKPLAPPLRAYLERFFNLEEAEAASPGFDFYLHESSTLTPEEAVRRDAPRLGWSESTRPADLVREIYRSKVEFARRAIEERNSLLAAVRSPLAALVEHVQERVGPLQESVLIQGESGTGKELIARLIHASSLRAKGPFVAVNIGALSESLIESELFGHEKGAFTGALQAKAGKFELASGGTLFLDEIGELKPDLQIKLLRVLQEREVDRVGGTKPVRVDVRIVAATNRDLKRLVEAGTIREDFYYRIHVIPLELPPLRERLPDVRLLVASALDSFNRENGRFVLPPDRAALARYEAYPWPGNVRELLSWVSREASRQKDGESLPFASEGEGDLGGDSPSFGELLPAYDEELDQMGRQMIEAALEQANGNVKQASRLLRMNYHKLRREIARLGIRGEGLEENEEEVEPAPLRKPRSGQGGNGA
ncbi:MAG: sigma 54-interacting transcriptional regulator [Bdellovibrionota bacterium]